MKLTTLLLFVTCTLAVLNAPAETDAKQRAKWIKHLQLMVGEDPKGDILIETESDKIGEALKAGDPQLARNVILASGRMMDNESLFSLVAYAVLYNTDAATQAIRSLDASTRAELLRILPDGALITFYDAPQDRNRYKKVVREVIANVESGAAPAKSNGVTAVIEDPDGYTNVRSKPDKSSEIVGTIKQGVRFTVLSQKGDWWSVETADGKTGFVHRSRIRIVE